MRIAESELIINPDGSAFHLHLRPEQLADNIILVGDPDRVTMIAKYLTDIEFDKCSREFHSTTGRFNGKRVTVISTGIGIGNCDIVMNELDALANIDFSTREVKKDLKTLNILRIGTSGAIQPDIPLGSYLFSYYSVGCDGLMNWYADREKIIDAPISEAFRQQTGWDVHLGTPYFIKAGNEMAKRFEGAAIFGCTITAAGFYGPQGRVVRVGLAMPDMIDKFEKFEYNGYKITNFEMETSVITGLGRHLGHNCGTICLIIAQRYQKGANPDYHALMEQLVQTALDKLTM